MIGQDILAYHFIYTGMEHGSKMEQYAKNMYNYRMYTRNHMIAICPYTQH